MYKTFLISVALLFPIGLLLLPQARSQHTTRNAQNAVYRYEDYRGIQTTLSTWARESKGLASVFTYGTSTRGQPLTGIALKGKNKFKSSVLIQASIHGNEPLSSTVIMSYLQNLLSGYGKDKELTELIDSRDIYIIPVLCPDSFPHSRYSDGVDPNRNFNGNSVTAIAAIKKFFLEKKPSACWSGHTYGRLFMYPYGDATQRCVDDGKMLDLYTRMSRLAGYRVLRGCQMYGHPIMGSEIDYYYRQNRSVSVVVEYGSHQRIPSLQDTQIEFNKTWGAFLLWLKEAPVMLKESPAQDILNKRRQVYQRMTWSRAPSCDESYAIDSKREEDYSSKEDEGRPDRLGCEVNVHGSF
jgi:hypothetical protein